MRVEQHVRAVRQPRGTLALVCAHVLGPLAVGFVFYLLWRPTTLWMFDWLDMAGLTESVRRLRTYAATTGELLPTNLLYNFPASCWEYSFCFSIGLIWKDAPRRQWQIAVALALVVGITGEALQLSPRIPGVFDWRDGVAYALAGALAIAAASRLRGAALW